MHSTGIVSTFITLIKSYPDQKQKMAAPNSQDIVDINDPASTRSGPASSSSSISLLPSPHDPASDPNIFTHINPPVSAYLIDSSRSSFDRGRDIQCPQCRHHFRVSFHDSGSSFQSASPSLQAEAGSSRAPGTPPNPGTSTRRPSLTFPTRGVSPLESVTEANSPDGQERGPQVLESGDGNQTPTIAVSQSEAQPPGSVQRTLFASAAPSADHLTGVQESAGGGGQTHTTALESEPRSNPHLSTSETLKAASGPHPTATDCAQWPSQQGPLPVSDRPPSTAVPQPESRSTRIGGKATKLFKSAKRQAGRPFRWFHAHIRPKPSSFMRAEEQHTGENPPAESGSGPARIPPRVEGTATLQELGQDHGTPHGPLVNGNSPGSSSMQSPPVLAEPTLDQDSTALPRRIHDGEDRDVQHQSSVDGNPEASALGEAPPARPQTTQGREDHQGLHQPSRDEALEASGSNRDMSQHGGVRPRRRWMKFRDIRQWIRGVYTPGRNDRRQQNGVTPPPAMNMTHRHQPVTPLLFRHATGGQHGTDAILTINGYTNHE